MVNRWVVNWHPDALSTIEAVKMIFISSSSLLWLLNVAGFIYLQNAELLTLRWRLPYHVMPMLEEVSTFGFFFFSNMNSLSLQRHRKDAKLRDISSVLLTSFSLLKDQILLLSSCITKLFSSPPLVSILYFFGTCRSTVIIIYSLLFFSFYDFL